MTQNGADMMEKLKKIFAFGEIFFGQTWEKIVYDRGGGRWTSPVVGLGGVPCPPPPKSIKRGGPSYSCLLYTPHCLDKGEGGYVYVYTDVYVLGGQAYA